MACGILASEFQMGIEAGEHAHRILVIDGRDNGRAALERTQRIAIRMQRCRISPCQTYGEPGNCGPEGA